MSAFAHAQRLAVALTRRDDADITVFLTGDAVTCAIAGQNPDGYYPSIACSRSS